MAYDAGADLTMAHIWIPPSSDPDQVARNLAYAGAMARSMPPSWIGAHISHPYCGPGGEYIGRVLPGKGLYLNMDPKELGMTHFPAHVFPRSPIQRLIERFIGHKLPLEWAERGAITTYDGIINARGGGKGFDVSLSKASITTVATAYSTLFRAGGFPVAGTYTNIPGGAEHTRASTGAWSFGLVNPTSPDKKYLLSLGYAHGSTVNMIVLVDLLVAAGNINANVTGNQTINSVALTRYTNGNGVMMTFDVTTALGATASNLTVNSYTDQGGTAAQTTPAVAMTTSAIANRLQPTALGPFMELASGDFGVRSVETLAFSSAMGAGVVALNLYFPLAFVPGVASNIYVERDSTVQIDGITELVLTAGGVLGCLTAYCFANGTSSGTGTYFLRTCDG